jgi:hypothetical protein
MVRMGKLYSKSYKATNFTPKPRPTKKARKYIQKQIKRQIEEGKPQNQAIAIAFSKARRKGYKV